MIRTMKTFLRDTPIAEDRVRRVVTVMIALPSGDTTQLESSLQRLRDESTAVLGADPRAEKTAVLHGADWARHDDLSPFSTAEVREVSAGAPFDLEVGGAILPVLMHDAPILGESLLVVSVVGEIETPELFAVAE